jgi:uncharacterized protein (DUF1697 family)
LASLAGVDGEAGLSVATYVALLHSISLGTAGRLKMADLRDLAGALGLREPRTLVATGNLVFEADETPIREIEARLETAYRERFGHPVDIIVRSAEGFLRLAAHNPFPNGNGPDVGVRVMRKPLGPEVLSMLARFAAPEIRMALVDGDLWVDFSGKPGDARLLSHLTTKKLGVGTLRNANTINSLARMLG